METLLSLQTPIVYLEEFAWIGEALVRVQLFARLVSAIQRSVAL